MGQRIFKRLRELIDVDTSGAAPGDALVLDTDGETWVPGTSGGPDTDDQTAAEVPFTPAGNIAATDVQAALEELDSEKASASAFADHSARHENGGADEISVDGLSGLLADAQTPLAHVHDGGDVTTGTVADARIASTIARDSEVTAAVAAEATARDAAIATSESGQVRDGDAAGGVLGGTYPNPSFAVDMATQAELDAAVATTQPLDSDLTAIGGLTPTNDDIIQRKAGAWTNRTLAQLLTDLNLGALYQPLDSDLTAFAGLAIAADKLPYGNGSHTLALADFTAAARALLDDADAAAMLTTLGVSTFIKTLVDDSDAATARATLGVIASLFQSGGAQAIKLDDLAAPDDNTDLNASTSAHGLLKKLPGGTTTFLRGDGSFAAPATGTDPYLLAPGDKPPSSANAMDDEFDDSSFNTGLWSDRNSGPSKDESSYPGVCVLTASASNATNIRGIEQAISGSFDIRAKLTAFIPYPTDTSRIPCFGIYAANNGSGKLVTCGMEITSFSNIGNYPRMVRWNSATSGPTATVTAGGSPTTYHPWPLYFRLVSDGTTLKAYYSFDGIAWGKATEDESETIATHLSSIDRVGIYVQSYNNNSLPLDVVAHWFRRVA